MLDGTYATLGSQYKGLVPRARAGSDCIREEGLKYVTVQLCDAPCFLDHSILEHYGGEGRQEGPPPCQFSLPMRPAPLATPTADAPPHRMGSMLLLVPTQGGVRIGLAGRQNIYSPGY